MENQKQQSARRFAGAFAASLSKSLSESLAETAGDAIQLKVLESSDNATPHGQQLHFRLTADGALQGECFVEFFESQVAGLAAKLLGKPPVAFEKAHAEALAKAISSAMSGLCASLSAEYGEFTLKADQVTNPVFDRTQVVSLAADQPEIKALFFFDAKIMESIASQETARASGSEKKPADSGNLKLVMDVELNVALRFGQRQLPLREVLDLTSGSVVELDCQVDEPIELLLDGKVIALGEAVIVDGNYGLRVTEIPQPLMSHLGR